MSRHCNVLVGGGCLDPLPRVQPTPTPAHLFPPYLRPLFSLFFPPNTDFTHRPSDPRQFFVKSTPPPPPSPCPPPLLCCKLSDGSASPMRRRHLIYNTKHAMRWGMLFIYPRKLEISRKLSFFFQLRPWRISQGSAYSVMLRWSRGITHNSQATWLTTWGWETCSSSRIFTELF